jgi:UDP-glucose 4-epimerase
MKVLVTGGAGFVGTNLISRLLKENHQVYSLDNYSIGKVENHVNGATYINGDIVQINDLIKEKFELCFHLAGLSRIQPSFENPFETFEANTKGTLAILEWARKNFVKVVYSGSSSKHHNPFISPYATFKYLGEEICKLYRETFNIKVEIVRFYNVYGPFEIIDGDWAAVIGKWRGQIQRKEPITIVGDGEQKRDFTHVEDIVDGLIKIANSSVSNPDGWELGTGQNYSINEVYDLFNSRFKNIEKIYIPDQKGNYRETLRENNYALEKLNWRPKDRLNNYIKNL